MARRTAEGLKSFPGIGCRVLLYDLMGRGLSKTSSDGS
jgi:hypothetical protein